MYNIVYTKYKLDGLVLVLELVVDNNHIHILPSQACHVQQKLDFVDLQDYREVYL